MRVLGLALLLVGCATPPLDPPLRPAAEHVPPAPCTGLDFAMVALGTVTGPTGLPLADVPISRFDVDAGRWVELTRTKADGTYEGELPGPGWVGIAPWRALPEASCVALPENLPVPPAPPGVKVKMGLGGNDFFAPPLCAWRLDLPGAAGAAKLVGFRAADRFELDLQLDDGEAEVQAPCDLDAVAVFADGVISAADGHCGAPRGAACVQEGGGDVRLAPASTRSIRVLAEGVPGAVLTDGIRSAPVVDGITWLVPDDARLRVDVPEAPPAVLDLGTGRAVGGALDGDVWRVAPTPTRLLDVGCRAAGVDVPCPPRVACGPVDGEALPCTTGDGVTVCACPTGEAKVTLGTRFVHVPEGAVGAWLDLGPSKGGLLAKGAPGCHALAVRELGWTDVLSGGAAAHTRHQHCDALGVLAMPGLDAGTWSLEIDDAPPVTVSIGDTTVDLTKR